MPDKCEDSGCRELAKLEQEIKDVRERNGMDHKEFREQIQKIERDEARQEGRLDNITTMLNDIKGDNKEIIGKLNPISVKVERMDTLCNDVEELKSKPGKKWEELSFKVIGAVVLAVVAYIMGRWGM